MDNSKKNIMIIDDEPEVLESTSKLLSAMGYNTITMIDPESALKFLTKNIVDLILCDLLMPNFDGMQMLKSIKQEKINSEVIILTAYGTIDRAVECMKAGAYDFIEKPFETDHVRIVIERALDYSELLHERNSLLHQMESKYCFENIIGKSIKMQNIFEMVIRIAESDSSVLITGESGTGKELVARSLHSRSKRNHNPFVPVNCSAFPENLFEAEIFGHEKGAYTDAKEKKIGLLEYAASGTFFLDEVCEMPVAMQTKLLRVLQDKKFRRLGGNELLTADIRLISATNRNINELIKNGHLREDFYYRLNVFNINLPPLRERKEDIPLVSEYILKKLNDNSEKKIEGFTSEVIRKFESYSWPGNIRELENVIERAFTFSKDKYIEIMDLPQYLLESETLHPTFAQKSLKQAKQEAIENVERNFLIFLLNKYKGNITKVAEHANMTRRNAYRLIKYHNLKIENWRDN